MGVKKTDFSDQKHNAGVLRRRQVVEGRERKGRGGVESEFSCSALPLGLYNAVFPICITTLPQCSETMVEEEAGRL